MTDLQWATNGSYGDGFQSIDATHGIQDIQSSQSIRGVQAVQRDQETRRQEEQELEEVYQQKLMYFLMGIGGLGVCCCGILANGLSVAVLTRRSMRSSTYTYLSALAVCDSLVLVFTALLLMKDAKTHDATAALDHLYSLCFPYVHPTAIVFQVTSIWLTLAFTVDRYIMICHPFRAQSMCRRSRARKVVGGLYVAGAVFCVPKFLEYYTQRHELSVMNATEVVYVIDVTELGKNEVFREVVHSWMYLICVCGLPFLTLVVLNAFLMHAVRLSRRKGKELNAREKRRNDTTVMLIGVVVLFLICQGPALVSRMIYAFKPMEHITRADFTLNEVANFLVILNSAINILPYYLFGHKFRSQFRELLCGCVSETGKAWIRTRSYSLSLDPSRRWSTVSNGHKHVINCLARDFPGGGRKAATGKAESQGSQHIPLIGLRTCPGKGRERGSGEGRTRVTTSAIGQNVALDTYVSSAGVNGHASVDGCAAKVMQLQVEVPSQDQLCPRTGV